MFIVSIISFDSIHSFENDPTKIPLYTHISVVKSDLLRLFTKKYEYILIGNSQ